jgi:pilus assembly protein CpaB
MKRRVFGIGGAIALALVGTLVLVAYVQSAHGEAIDSERLVKVWVVKKLIAKGTPSEDIDGSVGQVKIPNNIRAEGGVTNLRRLKGLVSNAALVPGEQLLASRFDTPEAAGQGGAPKGLLQVTVKLEPERTLGGKVKAGDIVGVLLSAGQAQQETPLPQGQSAAPPKQPNATHLQLHKVLVTGVQTADDKGVPSSTDTSKDDKKDDSATPEPAASLLVTLALDAPSIEKVVWAAEYGTIWLSNEPIGSPEGGTQIITPSNVYGQGNGQESR